MFMYITSGTAEYMEILKKKYHKETMFLLHGAGNSILIHETEGKTKFSTPRKYEVINKENSLEQRGYFVLYHIPVDEETKSIFEQRISNQIRTIQKQPGLIAFRLLKPIKSDTYILLTQWTNPNSFEKWKKSSSLFENEHHILGAKKQNIFNAASYITTYTGGKPTKDDCQK